MQVHIPQVLHYGAYSGGIPGKKDLEELTRTLLKRKWQREEKGENGAKRSGLVHVSRSISSSSVQRDGVRVDAPTYLQEYTDAKEWMGLWKKCGLQEQGIMKEMSFFWYDGGV